MRTCTRKGLGGQEPGRAMAFCGPGGFGHKGGGLSGRAFCAVMERCQKKEGCPGCPGCPDLHQNRAPHPLPLLHLLSLQGPSCNFGFSMPGAKTTTFETVPGRGGPRPRFYREAEASSERQNEQGGEVGLRSPQHLAGVQAPPPSCPPIFQNTIFIWRRAPEVNLFGANFFLAHCAKEFLSLSASRRGVTDQPLPLLERGI